MSLVARGYPVFCNMKGLGVVVHPPGWDASPSQGYPQHQIRQYPFIHLGRFELGQLDLESNA